MKKHLFLIGTAGLLALPAQAALTWTGTVDNDIFNDANWGDGSAVVSSGTQVQNDLIIDNGDTVSLSSGWLWLDNATPSTLTIDNGILNVSSTINGTIYQGNVIVNGTSSINQTVINTPLGNAATITLNNSSSLIGNNSWTNSSVLNLNNTSYASIWNVIGNGVVNVHGGSFITNASGGNPLNGGIINFFSADGGTFFFDATNTGRDELSEVLAYLETSNITVDGSDYTVAGGGLTAVKNGDDWEITAVPEPSAALLGGLGFLALLRRRRA